MVNGRRAFWSSFNFASFFSFLRLFFISLGWFFLGDFLWLRLGFGLRCRFSLRCDFWSPLLWTFRFGSGGLLMVAVLGGYGVLLFFLLGRDAIKTAVDPDGPHFGFRIEITFAIHDGEICLFAGLDSVLS